MYEQFYIARASLGYDVISWVPNTQSPLTSGLRYEPDAMYYVTAVSFDSTVTAYSDSLVAASDSLLLLLEETAAADSMVIAAYQDTAAVQQAAIAVLEAQRDSLQAIVDASDTDSLLAEIAKRDSTIAAQAAQIAALQMQVAQQNAQIAALNVTIAQKDQVIAELYADLQAIEANMNAMQTIICNQQGKYRELIPFVGGCP
jgi:uncharacterized coiled-coil protein SlyX